jgi:hypothetical protein
MASDIERFARRYIELAVAGYIDDDEAVLYHRRLLDAAMVSDAGPPPRKNPDIPMPRDLARAYILSCLAAREGIDAKTVQKIMHCTHAQAMQFIQKETG